MFDPISPDPDNKINVLVVFLSYCTAFLALMLPMNNLLHPYHEAVVMKGDTNHESTLRHVVMRDANHESTQRQILTCFTAL